MVDCIARASFNSHYVGGVGALVWLCVSMPLAAAQAPGEFPPELVQPRVARPAGSARRLAERLEALVRQENWDQVAATADELLATGVDGWIPQTDDHFIGLHEWVDRRVAELPAAGLAAYRARVDPLAEQWLRRGLENRDERILRRVVQQAFCSSFGDDALWALGDIALERGQYQAARDAWQRLAAGSAGNARFAYPDSSIPAADVLARLALVSIREGDFVRSEREIAALVAAHAEAQGRLGGRQVAYAQRLPELLSQAHSWPEIPSGLPQVATARFEQVAANELAAGASPVELPAPAVFPAIADGWLVYQDAAGVHGIALDEEKPESRTLQQTTERTAAPSSAPTIDHGRVFAIVPTTSKERPDAVRNRLVALDMSRDGALVFQRTPDDEEAIFMGPPLAVDGQVVVCELSPQQGMKASLAAFDAASGAARWRRSLGFAFDPSLMGGSPSLGIAMAHKDGVLYVATQLGMIAACRFADGEPLWLRTYPRVFPGGEAAVMLNRTRRPNPPLAVGSRVIVSADDSDVVMAVDSATGSPLWSASLPATGAFVLAADGERVILSGDRLWALDVASGKIDPSWGEELAGGAGQGAVADDCLLWPTGSGIARVDRQTGKLLDQSLSQGSPGGVNLAIDHWDAGGTERGTYLAAAGSTQLIVLRRSADSTDAN